MARLRLVQDQLVVGEMRFDAAYFKGLRRLDILLVEFGPGSPRRNFLPLAALLILLRSASRKFVEDLPGRVRTSENKAHRAEQAKLLGIEDGAPLGDFQPAALSLELVAVMADENPQQIVVADSGG